MKKIFLILIGCQFITSCTTHSNVPTALPPMVQQPSISLPIMPSKAEFLKPQTKEVKKAFLHYEKTGDASFIEEDQSIQIPFGKIAPVVNCTPLRTCDIKLEMGEKITGVYPGDTARWIFEEATSGEGDQQEMHVIFKPKAYDITTNAIITTTKRTYSIELHSKKDVIVKQVSFYYPEDMEEQWKTLQKNTEETIQQQKKEIDDNQISWHATHFDFNYRIETGLFSSLPIWTPQHVFNDSTHVYIEMPSRTTTSSLPTLFIVNQDNQLALVNFRVQKPYYIVDQLFQKAVLISGVGQNQQRVTITYKGAI